MSHSEFRYNKRRKHYAYLFKDIGFLVLNIVISSKPTRIVGGKAKKNLKLFRHPNPNSMVTIYLIPYVYIDSLDSFGDKLYPWEFDKNDKRIVKRLKKRKIKHK